MVINTQDTNYSLGGMVINTQDTNYSIGGMVINTQLQNFDLHYIENCEEAFSKVKTVNNFKVVQTCIVLRKICKSLQQEKKKKVLIDVFRGVKFPRK